MTFNEYQCVNLQSSHVNMSTSQVVLWRMSTADVSLTTST